MSNAIGIDEDNSHLLSHPAGRQQISTMGVDECIAIHLLILILRVAQSLIFCTTIAGLEEVATHNSIHQNGSGLALTSLTDKATEVLIERSTRLCVTCSVLLLIVMTKLNHNIVARPQLLEHSLPTSFSNKALRRTSIHSMIAHSHMTVEATLEHHPPPSFRIGQRVLLVGSR